MALRSDPVQAPDSLANGNGVGAHHETPSVEIGPPLTLEEIISAEQSISESELFRHTETLASDEYGGRFPCTDDETLTLDYLQREALKIGMTPGNKKAKAFTQPVPLVKITPENVSGATISSQTPADFQPVELKYGSDLMIWTSHLKDSISIDLSEIVFIGYGIKAHQWEWNDYSQIDIAGKTVLVLVNDPGFATNDTNTFNGRAMTYYGRWTYKVRKNFGIYFLNFELKNLFGL